MKKTLKKIISLNNKRGQGIMEYMIIASLVGIACLAVMKGFGQVVKDRVKHMKEEIVQNIDINN